MTDLSRRRFILAATLGATLGGCGFRLRGAIDMPFTTAYVDGSEHDTLLKRLRRDLRANGVTVTDTAKAAQVNIRTLQLTKERDILSLNADGKAREYRLFYTLKYAVDRGDGTTHYVARALHWSAEAKEEHARMGFEDGWGKAADQLEALARSL